MHPGTRSRGGVRRIAPRAGLTLLEILIVLAILGLLVGVGIANIDKILGSSRESVARIFVRESMRTPLMTYRIQVGNYPTTAEGLQALATAPADKGDRWRGPYVDVPGGQIPPDPWGNPYQYRFPGTKNPQGYDLYSFGPDGVESADDIGNW